MRVTKLSRSALAATRDQFLRYSQSSPRHPVNVNMPVTGNCNARCTMCDVWKTTEHGELTSDEVAKILSSTLFRKVRHVGLSGGEPALRGDLPEYVASVVASLPKLQSLSITTHGFMSAKWQRLLPEVKKLTDASDVNLRINISVDGPPKIHDSIRGVRGGYFRASETAKLAVELGIDVEWQFTAIRENVYSLPDLLSRQQEAYSDFIIRKGIEIPRLDNIDSIANTQLGKRESSFFLDVLRSDVLNTATKNLKRRLFYRSLAQQIESHGPRSAPCVYRGTGLMMDAQGDVYQCSIAEYPIANAREQPTSDEYLSKNYLPVFKSFVEATCTRCQHDQSGPWRLSDLALGTLRQTRFWKHTQLWLRAISVIAWASLSIAMSIVSALKQPFSGAGTSRVPTFSAAVVGNYGGEHVGDAAILAGVARQLAHQGFTRMIVLSTRAFRTDVWAEEARSYLEVDVLPYRLGAMRVALEASDRLVYAGGPIMEGPELLARHLAVAAMARARGLSTHAVAVGWGPFRRKLSVSLASALVRSFETVSVRSEQDAAIVCQYRRRCTVDVDRDAAEGYLDTVVENVLSQSSLKPRERKTSDVSMEPATLVIGLCLRPYWHPYTSSSSLSEKKYYTDTAEAICDALAEASNGSAVVKYFAMNADFYGGSDFLAVKHVEPVFRERGVNFDVVYQEFSVSEALSHISEMNLVLSSRFHALVFARRLNVARVGISIAPYPGGKVLTESQLGPKSRGVLVSHSLKAELGAAVSGMIVDEGV